MLRKLSFGLIVVLASACGSARVIQRTQSGGVIELSGDRGKAMEQANADMASHCGPNNFTIVQEGEEAVGTDTYTQEQNREHTNRNGRTTTDTTQGQTSTRTATAWRVHYQCNGAAGGPPPGGPGPVGGPPPGGDPNQPPPPAGGGY